MSCWRSPSSATVRLSTTKSRVLEANQRFALFGSFCNDAQHGVLAPGLAGLGRNGRVVLLHRLRGGEYHSAQRRGATRSLCLQRGAARSSQRSITENPFTLTLSRPRRGSTTTYHHVSALHSKRGWRFVF